MDITLWWIIKCVLFAKVCIEGNEWRYMNHATIIRRQYVFPSTITLYRSVFIDASRKCKRSVFANSTRTLLGFYTYDRTEYNIIFWSFPKKKRLNSLDVVDEKYLTLEIYNKITNKYRFYVLLKEFTYYFVSVSIYVIFMYSPTVHRLIIFF